MTSTTRRFALPFVLIAALSSVSACSSGHSTAATSSASPSAAATAKLTVVDGWAKASDQGMSAAFGTLRNDSSAPITITSVSSNVGPTQLHVMAKTANGPVMKEADNFVIPAKGSLTLKPGSNHIMFMNLTKALTVGDTVTVKLSGTNGWTQTVTFPIRAYAGAKENYQGKDGSMSHSEMPSMSGSSATSTTSH